MLRIAGMAAGAVLTCLVFYRNHKNRVFKRNMKAVIQEFDLFHHERNGSCARYYVYR